MDNPLIPTVKYATLITVGDGVKTSWDFNFTGGYISPEHVKAFTEDTGTGELVIRPLTLTGPNTAQIVPAVADGLRLIIYRDTPKTEPLVDYGTGSILNESSLDKSNKQSVFIAAELADRVIADYDFSNALLYAVTTATDASVVANAIDGKATTALANSVAAVATANAASTLATSTSASLTSFILALATSAGASLVAWTRGVIGAVTRTVAAKLMDVVHVRDFGAVCDGVTDDTAAVQRAFDWVIDRDGPTTLDMTGGTCAISNTIVVKPGGHAHFQGRLKALPTFPLNAYMVEAASQTGGLVHHDLSFDIQLDGQWRTGGIRVDNYIRVLFKGTCRILHCITNGIALDKTLDAHEATLESGISVFEYLYGESSPGYPGETPARDWQNPTPTSVGIRVNSFDNAIGAVVSYYTGTGMIVNAQYNVITGAHLGGIDYGLRVTENASFTSYHQVYVDSAGVLVINPWHTEFIGCKFLHNTADVNFKFITLRPTALGTAIRGFKVELCSFHNIGAALVRDVFVDTSGSIYDFDNAQVRECFIVKNSHANCLPAYTEHTIAKFQTASTVWTVDFGMYFPFGAVQSASYSFLDLTNANPISNMTAVGGTSVTIKNSVAGNGTAYVTASVNNLM